VIVETDKPEFWPGPGFAKWMIAPPGARRSLGGWRQSHRFHRGGGYLQRSRIVGARSQTWLASERRSEFWPPCCRLYWGCANARSCGSGREPRLRCAVRFWLSGARLHTTKRLDRGRARAIRRAHSLNLLKMVDRNAARRHLKNSSSDIARTHCRPDRLFLPPCGAIGRRGSPLSSRYLDLD